MVPKLFKIPSVNLKTAWRLWLTGYPIYNHRSGEGKILDCPIIPFRWFSPEQLPKKVRQEYLLAWKPIFTMVEKCDKFREYDGNNLIFKATEIEDSFKHVLHYLHNSVSYCFKNKRYINWKVSTWSKMTQPSMIDKCGTETEKLELLQDGIYVNRRAAGMVHKRKRILQTNNIVARVRKGPTEDG